MTHARQAGFTATRPLPYIGDSTMSNRLRFSALCALALGAILATGCDGISYVLVSLHTTSALSVARLDVKMTNAGDVGHAIIEKPAPIQLPPDQSFSLSFGKDRRGEVLVEVSAIGAGGAELAHASGKVDLVPGGVARLELVLGGGGNGGDGGTPDLLMPDLAPPPVSFDRVLPYPTTNFNADDLVLADFNRDKKLDVAVCTESSDVMNQGTVNVFLGNGDGTLRAPARYLVGNNPQSIDAGDIDGDGKVDIATGNASDTGLSYLRGLGDGTFQPAQTLSCGGGAQKMRLGHFGRDARVGAAVATGNSQITLCAPDGMIVLKQAGAFTYMATGYPTPIVVDIDKNGVDDLLLAGGDIGFEVFLGSNNAFGASYAIAATESVTAVAAADFNRDGRVDVVAAEGTGKRLGVFLGGGDGRFGDEVESPGSFVYSRMAAGDLNGDGRSDVVGGHWNHQSLAISSGLGDGRFAKAALVPIGKELWKLAIGDLDGDGLPEILFTCQLDHTLNVLRNMSR